MFRNTIGAAAAALLLLTAAAPAGAAPVTVGSPLGATFTQTTTYSRATAANVMLPEPGSRVASPIAGTVRRWRVQGTGTFSLRVLHPNGDGTYTAGAASAPAVGAGASTVTATTSLPIEAGDLVGIDHTDPNDQIGVAGVSGASYSFWLPSLADGETRAPSNTWPGELAFNADVVPAPAVTAIIPGAGQTGGGTRVGIVGTDLAGASAVTFGDRRALSFTVDSDTSITAIAPPGAAGIVDVHVTTPSGTSATSDGDRFIYVAPAPAATPPVALPAPRPPGLLAALVGVPRATASGVRLTVACTGPAGGSCALATRLVAFAPKRRRRGPRVLGGQGQEGQARRHHRRRAQGQDRIGRQMDGDRVARPRRPAHAAPARAPARERHHGLDAVRRHADRPAGGPRDDQAAVAP